jgi:Dual-action HEIGH metallo-peptidase/Repeat of unknown function (DUF5648)
MLKNILRTSGILAGVLLSACNQVTQEAAGSETKDDLRREDYVVFEGDMLIQKTDFENFKAGIGRSPEIPAYLDNPAYGQDAEPSPLKKVTQRQLGTVVSAARIADVKIRLNGVPTAWVPYIDAAIAAYNQLSNSTAIRMRKVTSGGDIVIGINTSITNGACADASGPSGGAPGGNVTIYTNNEHFKRNMTLWTPAIIHELGHTIGLAHTNESGPHIPTTPLTQVASIMQGGTCASPAAGLTASDHKALIYFYPPAGTRPWMRWDDYANTDFVYSTNPTIPAIPDQGTFPLYVINVGMILTAPGGARVPLYRYYSASRTDHFYTNSWSEGQSVVASGIYVYEGITGYLSTNQESDMYPLNRFVNPADGNHFYSTNVGPPGYVQEGGAIGYIKSSMW